MSISADDKPTPRSRRASITGMVALGKVKWTTKCEATVAKRSILKGVKSKKTVAKYLSD